jgi:hypothetical protein
MMPDDGSGSPDDGSTQPDNSAFRAPDDSASGDNPAGDSPAGAPGPGSRGGGRRGPANPGGAQDDAAPAGGGSNSPADISRRLADEAAAADSGASGTGRRSRRGADGEGANGDDPAAGGSSDPNAAPGAPEVLPGSGEATTPPESAPRDETQLDALVPPLDQAGHTGKGNEDKSALWVTAVAFGVVLLVGAAWLWTRRSPFDPA